VEFEGKPEKVMKQFLNKNQSKRNIKPLRLYSLKELPTPLSPIKMQSIVQSFVQRQDVLEQQRKIWLKLKQDSA
jgi:hypothetical protein